MIQYIIVCPLVFLAGLVDSIAGGGGLISLPAYMIAGVPPHAALIRRRIGRAVRGQRGGENFCAGGGTG